MDLSGMSPLPAKEIDFQRFFRPKGGEDLLADITNFLFRRGPLSVPPITIADFLKMAETKLWNVSAKHPPAGSSESHGSPFPKVD